MMGLFYIMRKEIKSYFFSPVAWILFGLFLFIMGSIFSKFISIYLQVALAQRFNQPQSGVTLDKLLSYLFQNMAFFLCLLIPFITMKLFSEEKRNATLELLLTSPITNMQIVWGKFFSAFFLVVCMLALTLMYIGFAVKYGNPDLKIIASTYIGLLLVVSLYISLGLFFSSLTGSQAIAAIVSLVVLIVLWLLHFFGQGTSLKFGPIDLGAFLVYLSPSTHFNSFNEGLIHLKDIVYYITFTFLMLFLTERVVESSRWK